jgi:hypothetical protein
VRTRIWDSSFSRRWRCRCRSSGLKHSVDFQADTSVSEEHAASVVRTDLKMEGARSSETLVSACKLRVGYLDTECSFLLLLSNQWITYYNTRKIFSIFIVHKMTFFCHCASVADNILKQFIFLNNFVLKIMRQKLRRWSCIFQLFRYGVKFMLRCNIFPALWINGNLLCIESA